MIINIYSKGKYPADALSNFAPHTFDFDGFKGIPCMEAFLQSLKFEDVDRQREILYQPAIEANLNGREQPWRDVLFWKGKPIKRRSKEYDRLIESAYDALFENEGFRQALSASKGKILLHTIGKARRSQTVLTWWELCNNLYRLRRKIDNDEIKIR